MTTSFLRELRFSLRRLARAPGFTVVAVATLAIGIGANTAIFSVLNAVVLERLPFLEPERVVDVAETKGERTNWTVAPGNFLDWKERSGAFDGLAAIQPGRIGMRTTEGPIQVKAARVTADFFRILGVEPARGRLLASDEDRPEAAPVAVMAHGLWRRQFGGDPDVVGDTLVLEGQPYTVVGILPEDFRYAFQERQDLWLPLVLTAEDASNRLRGLWAVGRLASGVTLTEAQADMDRVAAQLAEELPDTNAGWGVELRPLRERMVQNVRPMLWLLTGAAAFVLLIACVNLTNLMLARNARRRHEQALTLALGAGRLRLAGATVLDAAVLALVGGGLGAALAGIGTRTLLALSPTPLPRAEAIAPDSQVLAFTLVLAVGSTLLFGLLPALRASGVNPKAFLQEGDARGTAGGGQQRLQALLVTAQSAAVLVLLIGAAVALQTFEELRSVDPGFEVEQRITAEIELPQSNRPAPPEISAFFADVLERVRALPGVKKAAATATVPLGGRNTTMVNFIEGHPIPDPSDYISNGYNIVSPGYFEAMSIPLVRGRAFGTRDHSEAPEVAIVNEEMAQRYWADQDPIGKRVSLLPEGPWIRIVGVVENVRKQGLDVDVRPELYQPYAQMPLPFRIGHVVLWAEGEPMDLVPGLLQAVQSVDPDQPVSRVERLEDVVAGSIAEPRFRTVLLGLFALAALLLGLVGIYGVVSYVVGQRLREVGIRMVVGAGRRDILGWILKKGLTPVVVGVVLGIGACFALSRVLTPQLAAVGAAGLADAAGLRLLVVVSLCLVAVAFVATWLPARRASRTDPMVSLRRG